MATAKQIEAHIKKELALNSEIDELSAKIKNGEYRTKTEKRFISDQLQEKRRELSEHLRSAPRLSD